MNIPQPLSHAYLITGGSPDSRMAFARKMAAAYLCEGDRPPCGACRHCRKVSGSIHPDVTVTGIPTDKREILVDQIRSLRTDVYIRPNEGNRKVYIIDPADAMRPEAQNALLKVLEEGPSYAAFLLLAEQPGKMLSTIRSRCEGLNLPPEEAPVDPALLERGEELARMLISANELELAEYFVGLEQEKLKSAQLLELLAVAERCASGRLTREPKRTVRVMTALKTVRDNGCLYPGVGHTLGWLCGELFR